MTPRPGRTRASKVLHLIETGGPGGAETVFRDVVTELPAKRWRSLAVIPVVDWLHGALLERGVRPLVLGDASDDGLMVTLQLRELLRQHRIDLVHAHLLGAGFSASLATFGTRVPVVCTVHGIPDLGRGGRLLGVKLRTILRARNRMVFVSDTLRRSVVDRYRLPERKVRVVHNGLQPIGSPEGGPLRAELALDPDAFLLGAIGNVRPAKDYGNFLRAIAIVRDRGCPVRAIVAGEGHGPLLEDLLRLRSGLDLDDVVAFLGFRSDVEELLADLDVFVLSSSTEGFSLSTAEALSHAKPVVATRSGGPEEIVRDGETGLLVPPEDPQALADAILRLYRDPELARALGTAGAHDMRERFSMQRMIEAYETIYLDVLPAHRTGSGRDLHPKI